MDKSGKDLETKKQILVLQKRIALLENENSELKKRLKDVANIKGQQDIQQYMRQNDLTEITEVKLPKVQSSVSLASTSTKAEENEDKVEKSKDKDELINLDGSAAESTSNVDGFTLDDLNDDDFNPRAAESTESDDSETAKPPPKLPPVLPPRDPNKINKSASTPNTAGLNMQQNMADFFSKDDPFSKTNPFGAATSGASAAAGISAGFGNDPFGMDSFHMSKSNNSLADTFQDFNLDELDPLKKWKNWNKFAKWWFF